MAAVIAVGLASAGVGAGAALAAGQTKERPNRAEIEAIVRDYILNHPEIIPEAVARLEQAEARKALAASRSARNGQRGTGRRRHSRQHQW